MVSLSHVNKGRFPRKVVGTAAAFALALGIAAPVPSAAYADDAVSDWNGAVAESQGYGYVPYSSTTDGVQTYSDAEFPEKLDLRERGVVTPVKFQNPWGTCWGFAAIAASETSILSELNTTYANFPLDLSERQLAYFSYAAAPGFADTQEGEGGQFTPGSPYAENPNMLFNFGGTASYATTIFSAGIGPLYEKMIPYRNEEGVIVCTVKNAAGDVTSEYLTDDQIKTKEEEGCTVERLYYAGDYPDPADPSKALHATWSVDEQYWLASSYELEESRILPEMWVRDEAGRAEELNQDSVNAIKRELSQGRAVSVAFFADTSQPNEQGEKQYINEDTWAHYTYKNDTGANHAVTIVGWDDNYAKENFLSPEDNPEAELPSENGAWLVKNSWGAETEEFPNKSAWGIVNDEGEHTGYFWLSYYDMSITSLETFDYDLESHATEEGEYAIDQYNYLIVNFPVINAFEAKAPSANVFTAAEDMTVRTMTCETTKPNTTVTYELYLLDEDDTAPTDGKLAAQAEETYEFGGFHRATLPEDEWVPMREGQRYAVVVTQYCNDDGKYYQSVASNKRVMSKEEAEEERARQRDFLTAVIADAKEKELTAKYINEEGMSEEEAKVRAQKEASDYVKDETVANGIAEEVELQFGALIDSGFKAVVNPGESYTSSGDGTWTDWSEVIKGLDPLFVYDNFPIKAFADYRDYADVETLSSLQQAIDAAASEMGNVAVSADGSDVAKDRKWVTQADRDALAAAIQAARDLMAKAGEDFETELSAATPGQEEAEAAIDALGDALDAFAGAQKPGTRDEAAPAPEDPKGPVNPEADSKGPANPEGDPKDKSGAAFSKTSDPLLPVVAGGAMVAVMAAGVAMAARKRLS